VCDKQDQGCNQKLIWGGSVSLVPVLLFLPLFPPFVPFPFYFLRLEVAPQIQLRAGKRQKFILGVIPSLRPFLPFLPLRSFPFLSLYAASYPAQGLGERCQLLHGENDIMQPPDTFPEL